MGKPTPIWLTLILALIGSGGLVAIWATVQPAFVTSIEYTVAVCANHTSDNGSFSHHTCNDYVNDGVHYVDLTAAYRGSAPIPGLPEGAKIVQISCFIGGNQHLVFGERPPPEDTGHYGSLSVHVVSGDLIVVSQNDRATGNVPLNVAVTYSTFPTVVGNPGAQSACL